AQDEQERLRHEDYRAVWATQAAQTKVYREEWEYREAEYQDQVTREAERKKAADQEFASLQATLYLLEKERAREREEDSQFRAEASRRMEEVSEKCNQAISQAADAIEETKARADKDSLRIKREIEHQAREEQARVVRDTVLREAELEELRMYREQAAAGRARQPRERTSSPHSSGTGRARGDRRSRHRDGNSRSSHPTSTVTGRSGVTAGRTSGTASHNDTTGALPAPVAAVPTSARGLTSARRSAAPDSVAPYSGRGSGHAQTMAPGLPRSTLNPAPGDSALARMLRLRSPTVPKSDAKQALGVLLCQYAHGLAGLRDLRAGALTPWLRASSGTFPSASVVGSGGPFRGVSRRRFQMVQHRADLG
ncbi:hypothetical protein PHMEG_00034465, partial [Phytophthora megakarya]